MTVPCSYPDHADHADLPEGWDEWRSSERCTHDTCIEIEGYKQSAPRAISREEREWIEGDRELMLDEFHGRDVAGNIR